MENRKSLKINKIIEWSILPVNNKNHFVTTIHSVVKKKFMGKLVSLIFSF